MELRRWQADVLLAISALLWGTTFVAVKEAVTELPAELIIAIRFLIGFLFLALVFGPACRKNRWNCLHTGIILGLILGVAYWYQTTGLRYTSPSASAFITGMNIVFVALIDSLLAKRFPSRKVLLGVATATAGLLILTWTSRFQARPGDLLTLFCAVLFGLHIVLTARWIKGCDPRIMTILQFGVVSALFWLVLPATWHPVTFTGRHLVILLLLGLFPTGIAFLFQTTDQKYTPPIHTAIILSAEPVFAALFSLARGTDTVSFRLICGGLLIVLGTYFSAAEEPVKADAKSVPGNSNIAGV